MLDVKIYGATLAIVQWWFEAKGGATIFLCLEVIWWSVGEAFS